MAKELTETEDSFLTNWSSDPGEFGPILALPAVFVRYHLPEDSQGLPVVRPHGISGRDQACPHGSQRGTLTMLRLTRLISTQIVVLTLAACGPTATHGIQTYRIASASVQAEAINLARIDGVLGGEVNSDGTACFWIGDGPAKTALFWPYGYKALDPPLAVYDAGEMRVAVVGERVTMAGGLLASDVSSILGCRGFTRFWGVGLVDKAT